MDDHDDDMKPRPLQEMLSDTSRIAFYESYLTSVLQAIRCYSELLFYLDYLSWHSIMNFSKLVLV